LKKRLIALAFGFASMAFAQIGDYLGPAILSSGATGVGNRSGQQVDLRFYAGIDGIYDSSVAPVAIDSKGNLITLKGLAGIEGSLGLYGTHMWRTSMLGVDYHGLFREYNGASYQDGVDQTLNLGFTWQKSRRLIYKASLVGGILSNSLGGLGIAPSITSANTVIVPDTLLFDSRSYYVQGGIDVTWVQSARTSYTFGGQGFDVIRQASELVGVEGWNARGTMEHRVSKRTSIGVTYQRQHFEFPKAFGQADINTAELFLGTSFGRNWSFSVRAGAFQSEVKGLQSVALSPVVAALLGQSTGIQAFYQQNIFPSGSISLIRKFKSSNLNFYYGRTVVPGNGVYLTSKSDSGGANYSYSGIRKVNLSLSGGYNTLDSLGQGIQPYKTYNFGGGITYTLPYSLHAVARYEFRDSQIEEFVYKHTGYRATVGLSFSPGKVPLSLW
jgi:hypothetical protein